MLAVAAGEPVRCQAPDRWVRSYEHAAAVLGQDQALALKYLDRVADGHAGHAIVVDKLGLRREPLAFLQPPAPDGVAELVSDLPENRPVAGGVQLAQPGSQVSTH